VHGDVADFEALLSSVETCAEQTAAALAILSAAPCALLKHLARLYPGDMPCPDDPERGSLVAQLESMLNGCVAQATVGEFHLEKVRQHVKQRLADLVGIHEATATRNAAWDRKAHYDVKVEKLEQSHPAFAFGDKLKRNKTKQDLAQKAFEIAEDGVNQASSRVAKERWNDTAIMLSELCSGHASVYSSKEMEAFVARILANSDLPTLSKTAAKSVGMHATADESSESTQDSSESTQDPSDSETASRY